MTSEHVVIDVEVKRFDIVFPPIVVLVSDKRFVPSVKAILFASRINGKICRWHAECKTR